MVYSMFKKEWLSIDYKLNEEEQEKNRKEKKEKKQFSSFCMGIE